MEVQYFMFDNKDFDLWADGYDKSVNLSDDNNEYPFAGYKDLLNIIYNRVRGKDKGRILDIGIGTGTLSNKLYRDGYSIYGVDFSERMIEIAKEKMPSAQLYQYDFSKGLPSELDNIKFDYIISTYALHHLDDKEKVEFINKLTGYLNDDGEIIIGDIAFETREKLETCKLRNGDGWDDEEYYIVYDEIKDKFETVNISFIPIHHCAGILYLQDNRRLR